MLLASILICVCYLGYLAQTTGLCMVRAVNKWKAGDREFLLAIMFSGVLIWVAAFLAHLNHIPVDFRAYKISAWFVGGGFLFGVGTAINNGCGISTLSRLTRGESRMLACIAGWLVGWVILAHWSPKINIERELLPTSINYPLLIATSLVVILWVSLGNRKKLWFGMMAIGLLSGFIYLYQPKWSPSGLLNHLSGVLIDDKRTNWPLLEQYIIFLALLLGMFLGAWYSKRFSFVPSNIRDWLKHLFAGTLMGIGASLAMGGNSVQLLLAMPILSPAGLGSLAGMLVGVWSGLYLREKFSVLH